MEARIEAIREQIGDNQALQDGFETLIERGQLVSREQFEKALGVVETLGDRLTLIHLRTIVDVNLRPT